jgi:hypothetical protein
MAGQSGGSPRWRISRIVVPNATGSFKDLQMLPERQLRFSFIGEGLWQLELLRDTVVFGRRLVSHSESSDRLVSRVASACREYVKAASHLDYIGRPAVISAIRRVQIRRFQRKGRICLSL